MSEEFKVPPDLSVLESQLGSLPVPSSELDRDSVLYQAGWAAAIAQQQIGFATVNTVEHSGRNWVWPAATGMFATLATVLALMLFHQNSPIGESNAVATSEFVAPNESAVETKNGSAAAMTASSTAKSDSGLALPERNRPGMGVRNVRWQGGVRSSLAARSQIDSFDWETVPVYDVDSNFNSDTKASRELLEEFLPSIDAKTTPQQQQPIWNWFSKTWGDVL